MSTLLVIILVFLCGWVVFGFARIVYSTLKMLVQDELDRIDKEHRPLCGWFAYSEHWRTNSRMYEDRARHYEQQLRAAGVEPEKRYEQKWQKLYHKVNG
jgi:hypothetical protein